MQLLKEKKLCPNPTVFWAAQKGKQIYYFHYNIFVAKCKRRIVREVSNGKIEKLEVRKVGERIWGFVYNKNIINNAEPALTGWVGFQWLLIPLPYRNSSKNWGL